jgi:GGDEF domain-containing protein
MPRDADETIGLLSRSYRGVKIAATVVLSFTGGIIALAALNIEVGDTWTSVRVPLYVLVLLCAAVALLLGVPLTISTFLLRDALGEVSYYRSRSLALDAAVAGLKDLAYTDPITGIPNSNALRLEVERTAHRAQRCLILIDLENFGSINKKHNHWKGDEYMREFSRMVHVEARRSEFLYKSRPDRSETLAPMETAKAFRKVEGGDEFFMLLEGPVIDGLGFLNRLQRRKPEFEEMSVRVLGEIHPFVFRAGIVRIAPEEQFDSVNERVSTCLQIASEPTTPLQVYWIPSDLLEPGEGSIGAQILAETTERFARAASGS